MKTNCNILQKRNKIKQAKYPKGDGTKEDMGIKQTEEYVKQMETKRLLALTDCLKYHYL